MNAIRLSTIICLLLIPLYAQNTGKKSFIFRGKVDAVDTAAKRLTVTNDPIEGWMGSMTMSYAVKNDEVVNHVKAGDQVTAKVYEGDFTLYDVQVVPQADSARQGAGHPSLSLEDLEKLALAGNPTMAQIQANLRAATGLVRQAGLYPNPVAGYYSDQVRGGLYGGGEQGAFISQDIVLGGKLGAARRVAMLQTNEVATSGEIQRLRIQNNVRALFYAVLAAQRMVEARQNLVKLAGDAVDTSEELGNIGQADRPDILQAEVEQQQSAVGLRVARQNLQASWRMLAAVIGQPDLPMSNLEGDLEAIPELNYTEWIATALRDSPEMRLAQQAVERAEAELSQARKAPIPDLQVTGILYQNYEPLPNGRPVGLMGGAQVGVQLPIFDHNQGNIAAAKAEIESAKQNVVRVKLEIQRNMADLFRGYDSARVTAQQYKTQMLPRAQQAYEMYRSNYQGMAGAYPQVLISQRTLFQLQTDYIQALEDTWQSALLIRGFGLSNGLAAPGTVVSPSGGGMAQSPYPVR